MRRSPSNRSIGRLDGRSAISSEMDDGRDTRSSRRRSESRLASGLSLLSPRPAELQAGPAGPWSPPGGRLPKIAEIFGTPPHKRNLLRVRRNSASQGADPQSAPSGRTQYGEAAWEVPFRAPARHSQRGSSLQAAAMQSPASQGIFRSRPAELGLTRSGAEKACLLRPGTSGRTSHCASSVGADPERIRGEALARLTRARGAGPSRSGVPCPSGGTPAHVEAKERRPSAAVPAVNYTTSCRSAAEDSRRLRSQGPD